MSINLTDEIEVKTKKGKLGAAKQIFLEGDTQTVENEIQDINSRHNDLNSKHESLSSTVSEHTNQIESNQNQITANKSTQDAKNASLDANMAKLNTRDDQITELVRGITATGGASVATTVTYDNTSSHLASATVQGAIDELQGSKIDKTSILQELGNAEDKVMSQKCISQEIIQGGVYDVSAHNNNAVFESLQALLSSSDLDTLIPISVRHGGMSIRFIQGSVPSSDNKYMQYRLMATSFSTNEDDWQGVDDVPTIDSNNLVTSSGVKKALYLKADQDSVDSIETRILPIENVIYSLLDGFNEIPSDGYGRGDTAVSFIFPTIYKEDTKISKVSLKRKVTDTTHSFKIASVIKNSSNQLIVNTLSDIIELPVVETNGIVNDFIVDYTIPANTQVALVFDKDSLLYTSSSATACLSNSVITAFDNLTIGNRLANEGPYTSQAAISLYTKEFELKPLVTQAELDAEGVRLEGLISAEETARENADGNLHNEILDVSSDIDKINTDLIPLKELKDVLVEGFNEVPSQNGINITLPVIIFKEVYKRDATITSLKIKVKEGDSTRKIRIASCIKNASNQVLVVTISDAITIPQTDSVETVEIQLETPFTIPKGHQFALMGNTTFIKYHDGEPASVAYINSYVAPTGTEEEKFNGVTTGTRLITIGSSMNEYKVFVAAYENKLSFKNFATKSELGAVENKVKEYTDENIASNQKDIDARRTLLNSVVVSKYKTELMAHGSLGIDGGNGYFYIIYYGSETQRPEGISSNCICRLSKVSQCNLYDSEVIDVLKKGETVANFIKDGSQVPDGFTQSSFYSPYDPNLLLVDITKNDVTTSYIRCIMTIADSSFIEGDTSADRWQHVGIGYRDVNRDTLSLSDTVVMSNLRYTEDNVDYDVPFTIAELNNMICRHFKTSTGRIGTYPLFTSKFVSYNGDIYGYLGGLNAKTGLSSTPPYDFAGVMLKSSDKGTTWEVVAWGNDVYTTFVATELAMWEAAMDIIGSRMYVIFKSLHSYIAYYDLVNNTWSKLIPLLPYSGGDLYVGESSSRPHIYAKGNYLYAMVNVDPAMRTTWLNRVYRSRVHIMKIDTDMNIIDERELLDDGSCQYFSVINQRGRDYILFTEDKAHLGYIYDPGLQQYTFRGKSNISLCVLDIFN